MQLPIPDKLPLPLQVHRHQGEPCPRCGTTIEAVHYEDYVMCYCPQDQTGGRRPQGPPPLAAAQVEWPTMIEAGQRAPDFTLPDQDGEPVSLLRPRAAGPSSSTSIPRPTRPGCTTQACGVRDHLPDYEEAGAVVLGVSPDPVQGGQEVPRQAGAELHAAGRRGPRGLRRLRRLGREVDVRQDLLGRPARDVHHRRGRHRRHVIPKVSPKTHDDVVLAALAELAAA